MFEGPVVFVDIETTGISFHNSRIIEIAAIRFENGEITQEYSTLVNPETSIPAHITSITCISSNDVAHAPTFAEIAQDLADVLEGAIFIAHNVRFDYSFIKHEFALIGAPFSPKLLCTVRLSRALYAKHKGHSLAKLIERHEIPVAARHRALEDARAMLFFTQKAFAEHGLELFSQAINKQLKTQSLPPNLMPAEIESMSNVPGVYIFRDENHTPLYVGKSITLKKRVMSHFQDTDSREVRISQQIHHIETINTGSELAALIMESKLIKELQPIYNRLLRRVSQYAMLIKSSVDQYAAIAIQSGNVDGGTDMSHVYGMFKNRTQAKQKLDEITRAHKLCPKLMGLEKTKNACFAYSLGKCLGACIGKESPEAYNQRFEAAFEEIRIATWEYPSAIALPLNELGESVVIEKWVIKGYLNGDGEMMITDYEPTFDVDEYRIVRRFIKLNKSFIQPYSF